MLHSMIHLLLVRQVKDTEIVDDRGSSVSRLEKWKQEMIESLVNGIQSPL